MNTIYVLILFAFSGNSNALSAAEFSSEKSCVIAGKEASKLTAGTAKEIAFVCSPK